jgi:hypothetical protein
VTHNTAKKKKRKYLWGKGYQGGACPWGGWQYYLANLKASLERHSEESSAKAGLESYHRLESMPGGYFVGGVDGIPKPKLLEAYGNWSLYFLPYSRRSAKMEEAV